MEAFALSWAPRILSILRFMTGLLLLEHATSKIFKFPFVQIFAKVDLASMLGISGILELIGGVLLVIGLYSRLVAFILSGMCAIGYFMAHAPRGFYPVLNNGDAIILFTFVLLYLAAAGAGPWSIDAMRKK